LKHKNIVTQEIDSSDRLVI